MRLHHGVYVDADVFEAASDPISRTRLLASAAIAALPGPAYAFGQSAALLHDVVVDRNLTASVSIVRPVHLDQRALRRRLSGTSGLKDVTVHRHALRDSHLTIVDGIPTVDKVTAAVTTAARSTLMWAVATLDSLAWRDPAALDQIPHVIDEWRGLRGLGVVREAATLARYGAQTALESISRFNLVREGLAEPGLQVAFHDAQGLIGYADMVWDDLGVIGEADGLGKYQSREDLIAEKRREDRLRALGWVVVRWTWDEVFRNPRAVAERIRRAATQARLGSAHIA
jgi:very-short-patch-repair endonuclease